MSDDDRWLRDDLHRLAGSGPDDDVGLAAVRARSRALRRRRTAAAGAATLAALALVGGLAALRGGEGADELRTADTVTAPDTSLPSSTAVVTAPQTTGSTPGSTSVPSQPGGTTASTPTNSPPQTSAGTPSTDTSTVTSTGTSTGTSTVTTAPVTRTFSSTGGSITVRLAGGALSLVGSSPADGYTAEVEDDRPDRVRVRFRGESRSTRIEVRLVGSEMVPDIDEGSGGPG